MVCPEEWCIVVKSHLSGIDVIFLNLLYTLVEKQPYLLSTIAKQTLCKEYFVPHVRLILMVLKQNHVR